MGTLWEHLFVFYVRILKKPNKHDNRQFFCRFDPSQSHQGNPEKPLEKGGFLRKQVWEQCGK